LKVLVIGATGYLGSHISANLAAAGHEVTGFARNDSGAALVEKTGATPFIGSLDELDTVLAQADAADATVFAAQLLQDPEQEVIGALLNRYKRTDKTFVMTSGTGVLGQRTFGDWSEDTFAEEDEFVTSKYLVTRRSTELAVRAAAQDGVRSIVVRPPAIWGDGGHRFVEHAQKSIEVTGASCYIGRGLNLYSHVHVNDLAELYRLAIEKGTAGALYHAVAGELNNRSIAECVAQWRGVESRSVTVDEAFDIWGKFPTLIVLGVSSRSRSPRSRRELGWVPQHVDVAQAILDGECERNY
jgi:nucleoside-diphosphate-sugar epimerase